MALNGSAAGSPATRPGAMPAISGQTRLLVVAPHPDDETIATGMLIQQVRAAGGEVGILLLTSGDNNPWPQRWLERRVWIGAADRQRWGRRRHGEVLQALQCLGLPIEALQFLGWPDMGVTDVLLHSGEAAVATLAGAIDRFRPTLVALPALGDRHPDHGSAHVIVRLALARQAKPPQQLTYLVHGQAPASGVIEISGTPEQAGSKHAALAAHRSQMALSGARMRRLAARPERYVADAVPSEATPVLPWKPPAWMEPWLRLSVVSAAGTLSWRWREAPLKRHSDGTCQLTLPVAAGPRFVRLASSLPALWIFDHWGWCEL
ncbi:PIG-L deacetylase family protein [Rhodanobacter umsongensis]|uniref:PIG-L deacetylase family protein n=1 Tax=Rhodanobacter umsongensis TaxID=633153 RepID=A0ABW0JNL9_9GAMM